MAIGYPKPLRVIGIAAAILAAAMLIIYFFPRFMPQNYGLETALIRFGDTTIEAELAAASWSRERGLSGRWSLPEGRGMLFIFQQDGEWGFWMKSMRFSIDILFIDSEGKVVALESGVPPESFPQVFYPPEPVRYVLEVPAGFAIAHGVGPGSRFSFPPEIKDLTFLRNP